MIFDYDSPLIIIFIHLKFIYMSYLYDYCCDYIEYHNSYWGSNVNRKVYDLSCEYILGNCTENQKSFLRSFFKIGS